MILLTIKLESVPQNKYYALKDREIIMIGDSSKEIAQKIVKAEIKSPVIIKFNGILEEKSNMESFMLNKLITAQNLKERYLNSI